ncbi:MAG: citrate synthase/methylcitrate synthase, partial [Candidatus Micrarchaeota archaeon]|nr:citrate synthase/methylcitrate synthase [Candidatus Micrarchaeota archaeon]
EPQISRGLEGVYITESTISKVDGQLGKLYYRGYPIEAIAESSNFEEVSYLLLLGKLPTGSELAAFSKQLVDARDLPNGVLDIINEMNGKAHPMDIVRTAVSELSEYDTETADMSPEANIRKSIRIISKTASIVATIGRVGLGSSYVAPDKSLNHVDNFLYMLKGIKPDQLESNIMREMFILHAEHSSNASTFGTLVAGSTLADIYAAVTAGIAVLKGQLHGGADEASLRMIKEIGDPDNTESYIEAALDGKKKIMGFGHRVYKAYDPRARIVKKYLLSMQGSSSEEIRRYTAVALRAEKLMVDKLGQSKGIWPNIDFFAGPIYVAAGIPIDLFTPIFAASRTAGWCAHLLEYWQSNRIFRPLEKYVGKLDVEYVPIDKRG